MAKVLQLDARDNVLIALRDLKQNEQSSFRERNTLGFKYSAKHKFATKDLTAARRS